MDKWINLEGVEESVGGVDVERPPKSIVTIVSSSLCGVRAASGRGRGSGCKPPAWSVGLALDGGGPGGGPVGRTPLPLPLLADGGGGRGLCGPP